MNKLQISDSLCNVAQACYIWPSSHCSLCIYSHSKKMHHDGLCSLSRSICHTSSKMKADTAKFLQPLWSKSLYITREVSNLKSDNLQYNTLGRWKDRLIDQASDVPSIFFHNFLQSSLQNPLNIPYSRED